MAAHLTVVHLEEPPLDHAEALGHMEDVASGVGDVAALEDAVGADDRLLDDGIVQRGHAEDVNYNNTSYDLELATFGVTRTGITNLVATFEKITGASGSGGASTLGVGE